MSAAQAGLWVIYSDGASRGNPGPASIGSVVFDPDGVERATVSEVIGITTNNVAEYRGLIAGVEKALELGATRLEARMDSELVVRQATGRYRVKHPGLIPYAQKLQSLRSRFDELTFRHVPREQNKIADGLANAALDAAAGR